jgi:hypothetical protein
LAGGTYVLDKMSAEGTSLEDIEAGNVAHTADDAVMNAILSDMNAIEAPVQQQQQTPIYIPPPQQQQQEYQPPQVPQYQEPMQFMQPEPSFPGAFGQYEDSQQYQQVAQQPQHQQQQAHYEEVNETVAAPLKKNSWSLLFDDLRDPLVVGLLVSLFSLPALHTWLAKRLTWAYKVGGSLSWIGFLIQFALVAGIFATYKQIMRVTGM